MHHENALYVVCTLLFSNYDGRLHNIQHKGDIPRHELHECPPGSHIYSTRTFQTFLCIVPVLIYNTLKEWDQYTAYWWVGNGHIYLCEFIEGRVADLIIVGLWSNSRGVIQSLWGVFSKKIRVSRRSNVFFICIARENHPTTIGS